MTDKISMTLDIIYIETKKILEVTLNCGGKAYNPFDENISAIDNENFDDLNKVSFTVIDDKKNSSHNDR